jgi:hypothetical protein
MFFFIDLAIAASNTLSCRPSHPFNPFSVADITIAGHGKCHGFRSEWPFIIFAKYSYRTSSAYFSPT